MPTRLVFAKPCDAVYMRICAAAHPTLADGFRNTKGSRFDDSERIYKTLYCAPDFETCYAETLLRDKTYRPGGSYEVRQTDHDSRMLQMLVVDVLKLRIVDLFGAGRRAMGFDNALALSPYSATQALSRALHEHADKPDGILYMSRFSAALKPALVLFERAAAHVKFLPGCAPVAFARLPEAFDALTNVLPIRLTPAA